MKLLFVAIMVLSSIVMASSAETGSASATRCIDAYHVWRPVSLGMVEHEFIGIHGMYEDESGDVSPVADEYYVFGLPKGDSDLSFLKAELTRNDSEYLQWFGSTCDGFQIAKVLRMAKEASRAMQEPYKNWLYYLGRMGVTPVAGKPCGNAAKELKKLLQAELRR
jgi:hypothetical protein